MLEVRRATRREWIGLAVIALPCLLATMDLTVLNLAVPYISADLKPSSSELLWIVDIYGFMIAGSLITMGALGDRIGRRRLLLIGAAAFGAASVVAAFSTSAAMLIATRALLGVAGATLAPSTLSLTRNMFLDSRQRTTAIGVWAASFSAGAGIGPLLGGLVLEHFWWGAAFLIGVPVMVLLLVLGPVLLPEFRDPRPQRLDLLSAAMSLCAVLAVIYGIKEIAQDGPSWLSAFSIASGVIVGILFIRRQHMLVDPLIDLQLFRMPAFNAALATNTLSVFAGIGSLLFIAQYLQLVVGLSPLQAGLWSVPSSTALVVGSMLAPTIARRVGAVSTIAGGMVLVAVGFGMFTQVHGATSLAVLVAADVVMSLGIAPVVTLGTDLIVASAALERAGAAAAISETGTELGGALGIAVLGSIDTAVYRRQMAGALPNDIPSGVADVARSTLGGAISVAEQLPEAAGTTLLSTAREAFAQSVDLTAAIGLVVVVATTVVAVVLLRRGQPTPAEPAVWSGAPFVSGTAPMAANHPTVARRHGATALTRTARGVVKLNRSGSAPPESRPNGQSTQQPKSSGDRSCVGGGASARRAVMQPAPALQTGYRRLTNGALPQLP